MESNLDKHGHFLENPIALRSYHLYSPAKMGSSGHYTSVFSSIKSIPYDEAYQVTAALAADKTPTKVDLGAGVYKDEDGLPWTLPSVKEVGHLSSRGGADTFTNHGVHVYYRQLLGSPMITPISLRVDSPLS